MAGDSDFTLKYILNFAIHHIFPANLENNTEIASLLNRVGFNIESVGNKIALPLNSIVSDFLNSFPSLQSLFAKAGWGVSLHNDFHLQYSAFLNDQLLRIAENTTLTLSQQKLQVLTLFQFARNVALGGPGQLPLSDIITVTLYSTPICSAFGPRLRGSSQKNTRSRRSPGWVT